MSLPATAVDGERVAGFGVGDRHLRRQAVDHDRSAAVDDLDVVVAGGAVDGDGVGRAVAGLAADGRR